MGYKRIFLGFGVPDNVAADIEAIQHSRIHKAKWVPVVNFHVTLAFIGSVLEEQVDTIIRGFEVVAACSFSVRFMGVGYWSRSKVLWSGLETHDMLLELKEKVDDVIDRMGYEGDRKQFMPHITLARLKDGFRRDELKSYLEHYEGFTSSEFDVTSFALYASDTSGHKVQYRVLAEFGLE